jgi:hypothetical protein
MHGGLYSVCFDEINFKRNYFLENIFRRLVRTKKLRKVKMQMSPESGNDRSPSPESGEHVWPDPAKIAGFRPDPAGSVAGSGHIRPDSGHVGQIRPDQCPDPVISGHFGQIRPDQWPDPVRSGRIPAILARSGRISGRIRSDQAGSWPFWPDSAGSVSGSGQIMPDSGHFGQIRPDQCPDPVKSSRNPADFCP